MHFWVAKISNIFLGCEITAKFWGNRNIGNREDKTFLHDSRVLCDIMWRYKLAAFKKAANRLGLANRLFYDSIPLLLLLYPLFSLEKKVILISCQSRSVVRPSVRPSVCPSVRPSVRPCVRPSVTFLVNVSPPKPLEVATSNFVGE